MTSATPSKAPNRRSRSRRPPAEIDARRLSHRPWHARPPGWRRPCRVWRGEEASAARGRPAQEHGRVPSSFRGRQEPSEGATRAVAGVGSRYRRRPAGAPCSAGPSEDPEFRQGLVASVRNPAARSDRPSPGTGSSTATTRNGHDWSTRFPAIVEAALRNRATSFVLDGEAVLLGVDGRSDSNGLHSRRHDGGVALRFRHSRSRRRRPAQAAVALAQDQPRPDPHPPRRTASTGAVRAGRDRPRALPPCLPDGPRGRGIETSRAALRGQG
ncbi:hypothetical protein CI1B_47600 [Bradyrhizobium ivorense]|uniref:ATP-dependent DNA ligase family profile domain-containing protein n=1 Tax=Bradyrhizobium ivorense TaxID=2511166 RepID=A0A508TF99_9BRAD|nr:hypothetical protein CI1B_47600 [Bradyrhizobium ivorense]